MEVELSMKKSFITSGPQFQETTALPLFDSFFSLGEGVLFCVQCVAIGPGEVVAPITQLRA